MTTASLRHLRRAALVARYHAVLLAALLLSFLAIRLLGVRLPGMLFVLSAACATAAFLVLYRSRREISAASADRLQAMLYGLDLVLITLAQGLAGGAWWLGATFYVVVIVSAYGSLPVGRARVVGVGAVAAYLGLLGAQVAGVVAPPAFLPVAGLAGSYGLALVLAVLGVLALVGMASVQRAFVRSMVRARESHRLLLETAEDMIFTFDKEGRFVALNAAALRQSGYAEEEALGRTFAPFLVAEDVPHCREQFEAALAGQSPQYEVRYVQRNGDVRWLWCTNTPIRDPETRAITGVLAIARDITSRREAEAALRSSEERYRLAGRATNEAIYDWDVRTGALGWSETLHTAFGHAPGTVRPVIGWWEEQIHPDDRPVVTRSLTAALEGTARFWSGEYRLRRGDGSYVPVFDRGHIVRGEDGRATRMIGAVGDLTERKRAAEALERSEASFRSFVENAPYGIYRSTSDGAILAANPALVRILGYETTAELLRTNLETGVYRDAGQRRRLMARSLAEGFVAPVELDWKRKDGSTVMVRLSGIPVRSADGAVLFWEGFVEDVTELRLAERALRDSEQRLRLSQRLEAVGQLAGGIAHDFNNLVTVVQINSELLLESMDGADARREDIEEIRRAAERASTLTRQLLAFSRQQVLQPKVLDLNAVVEDVQQMLCRLVGEDIRFETDLSCGLGAVRADPSQLEQVIVNLAVNARDAMPDGGVLSIRTANVELGPEHAERYAPADVPPGPYVLLAVSDTGCGMDAVTQARIFEPFFTTKETGRGTGLGLATVYGIVKQSSGFVWVYSELGQGTVFKVYLPRVDAKPDRSAPTPPAAVVSSATETILLVEDEAPVRALARRVLGRHGYRVLEAANGVEALQVAAAHQGPIHLVLSDVVMPVMGGPVLVEQLRRDRPGVRVLFMSGYADRELGARGLLDSGTALLEKPFTIAALSRTVQAMLSDGRDGDVPARAARVGSS